MPVLAKITNSVSGSIFSDETTGSKLFECLAPVALPDIRTLGIRIAPKTH